MDSLLDVLSAVLPAMAANALDDATFQKGQLVLGDELDRLYG